MLFNTPYFRVLNANTSSAPISIYTGNFLIQNREYGFKFNAQQSLTSVLIRDTSAQMSHGSLCQKLMVIKVFKMGVNVC